MPCNCLIGNKIYSNNPEDIEQRIIAICSDRPVSIGTLSFILDIDRTTLHKKLKALKRFGVVRITTKRETAYWGVIE